jgi:hypothetical protein
LFYDKEVKTGEKRVRSIACTGFYNKNEDKLAKTQELE